MALSESRADAAKRMRVDLQLIADMVEPASRILDIGCGDGALLDYLVHQKGVDGRGLELNSAGVNACVRQGLSVVQGDADFDLAAYPDSSFDYVILSQTLQATRDPKRVLAELVRIGRRAIVSFPNFGHWRVRWSLLWTGRMPETKSIPLKWHATPNIHFCTIRDFVVLCDELDIAIEAALAIDAEGRADRTGIAASAGRGLGPLANLLGEQGLFLLRRQGTPL